MLFKKNVHKKQTPGERREPYDRESAAFFNCPGICPGTPARSIVYLPGNPGAGNLSISGNPGVKTMTSPPQEITDAFPEKGIITSGKERI